MLKVTPYLELDEEAKQLVDHASNTTVTLTVSESAVFQLRLYKRRASRRWLARSRGRCYLFNSVCQYTEKEA